MPPKETIKEKKARLASERAAASGDDASNSNVDESSRVSSSVPPTPSSPPASPPPPSSPTPSSFASPAPPSSPRPAQEPPIETPSRGPASSPRGPPPSVLAAAQMTHGPDQTSDDVEQQARQPTDFYKQVANFRKNNRHFFLCLYDTKDFIAQCGHEKPLGAKRTGVMALSFSCQLASAVCLVLACQGFSMPTEAWSLASNAWAWNPAYSNGMFITPTGYATDSFVNSGRRRRLWQSQSEDASTRSSSAMKLEDSKAGIALSDRDRFSEDSSSSRRRHLLYTGAPPWYAFPPTYPSRDGTYPGGYSSSGTGGGAGGSSSWGVSQPPLPVHVPALAPEPEPHYHDSSNHIDSHHEEDESHSEEKGGDEEVEERPSPVHDFSHNSKTEPLVMSWHECSIELDNYDSYFLDVGFGRPDGNGILATGSEWHWQRVCRRCASDRNGALFFVALAFALLLPELYLTACRRRKRSHDTSDAKAAVLLLGTFGAMTTALVGGVFHSGCMSRVQAVEWVGEGIIGGRSLWLVYGAALLRVASGCGQFAVVAGARSPPPKELADLVEYRRLVNNGQDPGPNAVQSALFFAGGQVQKSAIAVEEEAAKHMPAAKALSQEITHQAINVGVHTGKTAVKVGSAVAHVGVKAGAKAWKVWDQDDENRPLQAHDDEEEEGGGVETTASGLEMPAGVSDGEYRVEYDLAAEQKNAAEGGGTSAATASSVEFTTPEQLSENPEEEFRIDEDGSIHNKQAFLEFYGEEEGAEVWSRAEVYKP